MINRETVFAERLRRQRLLAPVTEADGYLAIFQMLQPVSPTYFSCPGSPPSLVHRAAFDDAALTGRWRERREVVKGRFLGGTIGYVLEEDLSLYANAFRRPLVKTTWQQQRVLKALATVGPLTPRQISEETDLLNKEIMPALHRLQEAFLVYEDQLTADWERGWYIFDTEWPDIVLADDGWEDAAGEVLQRFLHSVVFATTAQIKDWSGWPAKDLKRLLATLTDKGTIIAATINGLGEGWMLAEDADLPAESPVPSVFMLHRADPLVRMHAGELKARYQGVEVLQYLLIDGSVQGAVCGHWRIGPHDVDDIKLDLPAEERAARREEIIRAVAWGYAPPFSRIVRYDGVESH